MTSSNSQERRNTATCILTLGDTRELTFQCFKDSNIPIEKKFPTHTFSLKHGSLFILHPRDEETILREYFDKCSLTYFKHGKVFFGEEGISIGLAFRTTFRHAEVNAKTGQIVMGPDDIPKNKFKRKLDGYISDTLGKDEDDARRNELYAEMMEKLFVQYYFV